jgi:hypothetical protein
MTKGEIIGGNKLIAEFMGYCVFKNLLSMMPASLHCIKEKDVKPYHSSWDALMPVYIKIVLGEMHGDNNDGITLFNIMYDRLGDADGIDEVWKSIVAFIKWYNTLLIPKPVAEVNKELDSLSEQA